MVNSPSKQGMPEPVVRSDSDVVEDPCVEQRQWRVLRTFNQAKGRIPTGSAEVEWTSEETPQDQQAPGNHAESVAAAMLENQRKCEERGRPEPWTQPTPSTGPTTPASAAMDGTTAAPEQVEPLERGSAALRAPNFRSGC